jgi:hypothetical protein
LILLLIGIGLGLLLVWFLNPILLDRYVPSVTTGVGCNRLSAPAGGNNRSLLALTDDNQTLDLDVRLSDTVIPQGQEMDVRVIFNNNDRGPVTLYFPELNDMVQGSGATIGVRLIVRNITNNAEVEYGFAGTNPVTTPYVDSVLHLLEARTSCRQSYELDLGLAPGEYAIRAQYFNNAAGVNTDPAPVFPNQNVWIGTVVSPELRFTVGLPPTAAPAAPPTG